MLLTFHFFLNIVLFLPPPSEHRIFCGTVSTDFFTSSSDCFSHLNDQKDYRHSRLSVSLYLLTAIIILSSSYLHLKLFGLNSYIIWVSVRLHIAFVCRNKCLNRLLKYNSQKCIQFLSLHRKIWHFSSTYTNNSSSFLKKTTPVQKLFSGRNLWAKNRPSSFKKNHQKILTICKLQILIAAILILLIQCHKLLQNSASWG